MPTMNKAEFIRTIKSFYHLNWQELLIGVSVFLLSFLLIFTSRYSRIHAGDAIIAEEPQVLLVYERSHLTDLPELLTGLELEFSENELLWVGNILRWRTVREGRYVFSGSYSYDEFLSVLARGIQTEQNVVIPPGVWQDAFYARVAGQLKFDEKELREAFTDTTFIEELGLEPHLLFGRMLPDTYRMYWTTSPRQFIRRILREFDAAVTNRYAERMEELNRSVDEIVTLASIIEWEARIADEKTTISGLYWNRLNRRWRLQADPTVNFALGERRRLIFADYNYEHPYNTYRHFGLPPGPITNPSHSAIYAALYPESHNYMYMVATPDGTHGFSRTYEEHQRKSREWTDWLREQRRIGRMRDQGLID